MTACTVRAHAKINLNLRVVGVRADGYHLLETVFQSLALHDVLTFDANAAAFELGCSDPTIPADERNLVWQAAAALWREAGRDGDPRGARGQIDKRVPAQGGLGGGSADAAAALVALDELWGTGLGRDRLASLAAELGADVPFFLHGGTALGLGRGDDIHPLDDLPRREAVLVFPAFGVSTPEAFRWFDEDARRGAGPGRRLGIAEEARRSSVGFPIYNELQPPVAARHPEIERLCARLREAGADAAAMTGSGSTVFGLFSQPERAASATERLAGEGWRTVRTRTASRREAAPVPDWGKAG